MRRHRIRKTLLLLFLLVLAVLFFCSAVLRTRLNPAVEELALANLSNVASRTINEAIDAQIAGGAISYDDMITVEKDRSGGIIALRTNIGELNRLKTELLDLLDDDIYDIDGAEISIPLGNLTGLQLLSGRGPRIPVRIIAVSASDADFHGVFTDAGINQTRHQILMSVTLHVVVLLPTGSVGTDVSSDVCVAETVIVGKVPERYTYFSTADDGLDTKYFAAE